METTTYCQLDIETELRALERSDLLAVEKLIAAQHRALASLKGQMDLYGLHSVAEDLDKALVWVTAAGVAVTLAR